MTKTLYVGNLPWAVTEDDLVNIFSEYTEVVAARVAVDRETGRSRGFGFVEIPAEKAEEIVNMFNGAVLGGRQLTVNEARPREERPRTTGGFRR